jgi:hypothetical protein
VDDEVDSGSTNAVTALRGRGVTIVDLGSAVEVLHGGCSAGRERIQGLGLTLKWLPQVDVDG